jgi:hypothetical protein
MNRKKQNKRKNPVSFWKKWYAILGTLVLAMTFLSQVVTMVSNVYPQVAALIRTARSAGNTNFAVQVTDATGLSAQANLTIRSVSQR